MIGPTIELTDGLGQSLAITSGGINSLDIEINTGDVIVKFHIDQAERILEMARAFL